MYQLHIRPVCTGNGFVDMPRLSCGQLLCLNRPELSYRCVCSRLIFNRIGLGVHVLRCGDPTSKRCVNFVCTLSFGELLCDGRPHSFYRCMCCGFVCSRRSHGMFAVFHWGLFGSKRRGMRAVFTGTLPICNRCNIVRRLCRRVDAGKLGLDLVPGVPLGQLLRVNWPGSGDGNLRSWPVLGRVSHGMLGVSVRQLLRYFGP